jgi:uncharacterized membrane protein
MQGLVRRESMLPPPAVSASVASPPRRLEAVDWLRGLVMVIMALDHARDFFSNARFDPTDLAHTTPAYFLTRWVTHFCAPVFIFLAGAGAYLHGSRRTARPRLPGFLLTRGLWLVFLEVTLIHFLWSFSLPLHGIMCQVMWAIGWSMVVLSVLTLLPTSAVTAIGIAIVAFHNTWDGIEPAEWGSLGWLWEVLHAGTRWSPGPDHFRLFVMYPLLPWVGVMACGYGFGALLTCEPAVRRRQLLGLGLALTVLFVVLRAINRYGDPRPWSVQERGPLFTAFSFLNCHKYPPSLLFLLMTLGPAIFLLGLMDRPPRRGGRGDVLATFGRVPLFYYVLHIALIHGAAVAVNVARYGRAGLSFPWGRFPPPEASPYDLLVVYLAWLAAVVLLYFPCRWFAGVKKRRHDWWLSYL